MNGVVLISFLFLLLEIFYTNILEGGQKQLNNDNVEFSKVKLYLQEKKKNLHTKEPTFNKMTAEWEELNFVPRAGRLQAMC